MASNSKFTYRLSEESMNVPLYQGSTLPQDLRADRMVSDNFLRAYGLYSKKEIEEARFKKYSRFGRVLDPYGRLNDCREYLFFVKPDLHICVPPGGISGNPVYTISTGNAGSSYTVNGLTLNPQLCGNTYFKSLLYSNPDVARDLQMSAPGNGADPFSHLLSFSVSNYLDITSSEASTLDNPSTVFGTSYEYLKDAEEADENPTFSLEFVDNKYLDTYHFFKAYSEYHIARKSGLVTPPSMNYYRYKRLHNTMGVYKFVVAEDMETIIYWAYFWGVYPTSVPRDAFSDPNFSDGLSYSVSFKAAFMNDMDPAILFQFNKLMKPVLASHMKNVNDYLPVVDQNFINDMENGRTHGYKPKEPYLGYGQYVGSRVNGTLPFAAMVDGRKEFNKRLSYKLRWYG